jgi:hypothetical protein
MEFKEECPEIGSSRNKPQNESIIIFRLKYINSYKFQICRISLKHLGIHFDRRSNSLIRTLLSTKFKLNISLLEKKYQLTLNTNQLGEIIRGTLAEEMTLTEDYLNILNTITDDNLVNSIISLYTLEGLLYKNLNTHLRQGTLRGSGFELYYILLQASIACISRTTKLDVLKKKRNHYVTYRGAYLPSYLLDEYRNNIGKEVLFDEFMSTTYDKDVALKFIEKMVNNEGMKCLFRVLFPSRFNRKVLACIENISVYKEEKEILLSSSCIFRIRRLYQRDNMYIIEILYI